MFLAVALGCSGVKTTHEGSEVVDCLSLSLKVRAFRSDDLLGVGTVKFAHGCIMPVLEGFPVVLQKTLWDWLTQLEWFAVVACT